MTDRLNEIKSYWEKAKNGDGGWWAHAMAHAPADLEWLIAELEKERARLRIAANAAEKSYAWFYETGEGTDTVQEQAMLDAWAEWNVIKKTQP